MNSLKAIWIFLFFVCSVINSAAQNNNVFNNYSIKPKLHYGAIIPHHEAITYLISDNVTMLEINICKKIDSSNIIGIIYPNSQIGLGFNYGNLGNDNVFGTTSSLYLSFNFPLWQKNRWGIRMQILSGLAYSNKYYDKENNHLNIAIGSKLNTYINFSLESEIYLNKYISIIQGIGFHHYSNGKVALPNVGINVLTANLGAVYRFNEDCQINAKSFIKPEFIKKNEIVSVISFGSKAISPNYGKNFLTSSIQLEANRIINYKYKIGVGIDVFYDGSVQDASVYFEKEPLKTIDSYRSGIHLANALIVGDFSLYVHLGYYVLLKDTYSDYAIYDRIGIQYKFKNRMIYNMAIKAHLAKADFVEFGFGYVIK